MDYVVAVQFVERGVPSTRLPAVFADMPAILDIEFA